MVARRHLKKGMTEEEVSDTFHPLPLQPHLGRGCMEVRAVPVGERADYVGPISLILRFREGRYERFSQWAYAD